MIAGLSACDDSSSKKDSGTTELFNQITPGQTARIASTGDNTPCFDTMQSLHDAEHARDVNDQEGFTQIEAGGHIISLRSGWRVRAIDEDAPHSMIDAIRFRLLSGENAGSACFVPADIVGTLKDVR